MTIYALDVALSGFDLSFNTTHSFVASDYLLIHSNIDIDPITATISSYGESWIKFWYDGTHYYLGLFGGVSSLTEFERYQIDPTYMKFKTFRFVFYHEFLAVEIDEIWMHTFYPPYIHYQTDTPTISMTGTSTITIANIRSKELSDWREAIYVDLESTSQNAIDNVIQQRPIEVYGKWNGSVSFTYFPYNRPTRNINSWLNGATQDDQENPQISSQAMVYHTNVGMSVDITAFARYGFITRVFRLPDLDSGAMKAASVMQKRARQSVRQSKLTMRMDPAIELGDSVQATNPLPGSGTVIGQKNGSIPSSGLDVIVESIKINHRAGDYVLEIDGRDNV